LSPEDAAHGELGALSDEELPMLAAHWLVDGYDSDLLRTVAGMTNRERHEARRMMPEMLASIGYPLFLTESQWDQAEWRGYWSTIAWAVRQMDRKLTPYAAAQTVLEIVIDVPELWEPADGNHLRSLLHAWDETPGNRPEIRDPGHERPRGR